MVPGRILRKSSSELKSPIGAIGKRHLTSLTALALACFTISCAGASVTMLQTYAENERLPRPGRVIVYDFAATPDDLPADDPIVALYEKPAKPQAADEVSLGRKLGSEMAGELVNDIRELGLPAGMTLPTIGIQDYFTGRPSAFNISRMWST